MNDKGTQCSSCKAICQAHDTVCWLCQKPLDPSSPPTYFKPPTTPRTTFTITSIMLVTTLLAVCFAIFRFAPGLGILACVVFFPAVVRTAVVLSRRKEQGERADAGEKVFTFLAAVGGAVLAGVTAFGVFYGTCALACLAGSLGSASRALSVTVPLGTVFGLLAGGYVLWRLWQRD